MLQSLHSPQVQEYPEVPLGQVCLQDPEVQLGLFFLEHLLHQVHPMKIRQVNKVTLVV